MGVDEYGFIGQAAGPQAREPSPTDVSDASSCVKFLGTDHVGGLVPPLAIDLSVGPLRLIDSVEGGGLKDTVVDTTAASLVSGSASGFSFTPWTIGGLLDAIRRAERLYREDGDVWARLLMQIMRLDRSWLASACEYCGLYEHVVTATR